MAAVIGHIGIPAEISDNLLIVLGTLNQFYAVREILC